MNPCSFLSLKTPPLSLKSLSLSLKWLPCKAFLQWNLQELPNGRIFMWPNLKKLHELEASIEASKASRTPFEPISKWKLQWNPSIEPIFKSGKKNPKSDLIDNIKLH